MKTTRLFLTFIVTLVIGLQAGAMDQVDVISNSSVQSLSIVTAIATVNMWWVWK